MPSTTLAIIYGLASALIWGAGDFSGGLATKRNSVYSVVLIGHAIGLALFILLALLFGEPFSIVQDLLWGVFAGLGGMMGVLLFYSSLARSSMGVVAPIAAVSTVILPTVIGVLRDGLPAFTTLIGFFLALIAIWFLAGGGEMSTVSWRDLLLPALAGVGFALFIVFIDRVSDGAVFWPLAAARVASVSTLSLFVLLRSKKSQKVAASDLPAIIGSGVFDAGGNTFLALATQAGRLDIASMLSSLYPASTVLLARIFLGERLTKMQLFGVLLALIALILVAI